MTHTARQPVAGARRSSVDSRARPKLRCNPGGSSRANVCEFTRLGILPDYKDVARLHCYITAQGKILLRRRSGLTAKMQRKLTIAIKRARHMALLPFVAKGTARRDSRR